VSDSNVEQEITSGVLKAAQYAGMVGCEALVTTSISRTATWQTSAVTGAVVLGPRTVRTLHLRVFTSDDKVGSTQGRVTEGENLDALVADAAKAAVASKDAGPAPRLDVPTMGLGIMDRRNDKLADEDRASVVENNVAGCGAVQGAEAALVRYTEEIRSRSFASSRGVTLSETGTHYSLTVVARLKDDQGVQISREVASRHFADVASIPLGASLGRQVIRYKDSVALPEEDLPVVLEPQLVAQIMLAAAPAFECKRVAAGESFITGDPDQVLGNTKVHMIDDAARPGGLATRSFDARGVPPMSIPLIREGKAGSLYTDVLTARAADSRPSGHQQEEEKLWMGNLLLRSGNRSRNMMFPDLGRFLNLDASASPTIDLNLRTGKINIEAHTFVSEAGTPEVYAGVQRFETDCISLWSAVHEIGSDQQRHGQVDVSTWILNGLTPVR